MKKNLILTLGMAAALVSCGSHHSVMTEGDTSKLDTLSYATGIQIGGDVLQGRFAQLPFDLDVFCKSLSDVALEKKTIDKKEVAEKVMKFISEEMPKRQAELEAKYRAEDSVRMAQGNTEKVERPMADPAIFASETERQDISEGFGAMLGADLKSGRMPMQTYWLTQALKDMQNDQLQITREEAMDFARRYYTEIMPRENAAKTEEWLQDVAKKSGVEMTESGVFYKIENKGDEQLMATSPRDELMIHFLVRNMAGEVVYSTRFAENTKENQEMMKQYNPEGYDKDEPQKCTFQSFFAGMNEGLKLIGKGGKIHLWLPAELAMGRRGGQGVLPNEGIEVEIEMVEVKPFVPDPESPEVKNAEASKQWLAEIEKKDNVRKTESGLLYELVREGDSKVMAHDVRDRVKVHYEGKLRTGKVFDSSYARKEPISFPLNGVIKGWTEGMMLVGKGGKIRLWIPAELAYGERGAGSDIGPNEALMFEIELLDVEYHDAK